MCASNPVLLELVAPIQATPVPLVLAKLVRPRYCSEILQHPCYPTNQPTNQPSKKMPHIIYGTPEGRHPPHDFQGFTTTFRMYSPCHAPLFVIDMIHAPYLILLGSGQVNFLGTSLL